MTVTNFPTRSADEGIELNDAFFLINYDEGTVQFTEEGKAYYERWFGRYGFRLDASDAEGFVKTVMFINRESGLLQADRLQALIEGGLSREEADLWRLYLAGDFTAFAQGLDAMADKVQAIPDNVVQLFRRS